MFTRLTRTRVAAMTAILCMGLTTGMIALSTGCATNANDYKDPDPAISAFTVTPTTLQGGSTAPITFKANFAVKGGGAVITPGNFAVESNVPVNVPAPAATTTYTLTVTSGSGKVATSTVTVGVINLTTSMDSFGKAIAGSTGNTASVPTVTGRQYSWTVGNGTITSASATTNQITYTAGTDTSQSVSVACVVTDPAPAGSNSPVVTNLGRSFQIIAPIAFSKSVYGIKTGETAATSYTVDPSVTSFTLTDLSSNTVVATKDTSSAKTGSINLTPSVTTNYRAAVTGSTPTYTYQTDVQVAVSPHDPALISAFSATPSFLTIDAASLQAQQASTSTTNLAWTLTGDAATTLQLNGVDVTGSSKSVTPKNRQSYTLKSSNDGNPLGDTKTLKVGVRGLDLLAGSMGGTGTRDAVGNLASFQRPSNMCVSGNFLFVADTSNHTIRKINLTTKQVTTVAGIPGVSGTSDVSNGDPLTAKFNQPRGIAVDAQGYTWIADGGNATIRVISPDNKYVYTLTGWTGTTINTGAGTPQQVFVNNDGSNCTVYVATFNGLLTQLNVTGLGSTTTAPAATTSKTFTINGGATGTASSVGGCAMVMVGTTPVVFVPDSSAKKIKACYLNGSGVAQVVDVTPTLAAPTAWSAPATVAATVSGTTATVFVADKHFVLRYAVDLSSVPGGAPTLPTGAPIVVGTGTAGFVDGTGDVATFGGPTGLALNGSTLYVAEGSQQWIGSPNVYTNTIRAMAAATTATANTGITVSTLAGANRWAIWSTKVPATGTSTGAAARFKTPGHLSVDQNGNSYLVDAGNSRIVMIAPDGTTSNWPSDSTTWSTLLAAVADNSATPTVYVIESAATTIKKFVYGSSTPTTITLSVTLGAGVKQAAYYKNGSNEYLYTVDGSGKTLKQVDLSTGTVTNGYTTGASGIFGVAIGATGTIYISEGSQISSLATFSGTPTAIAGNNSTTIGTSNGFVDGPGTSAVFYQPGSLGYSYDSATSNAYLYVVDAKNSAIRAIALGSTNTVSTLIGRWNGLPVVTTSGSPSNPASPNFTAALLGTLPGLLEVDTTSSTKSLAGSITISTLTTQGLAVNPKTGDLVITSCDSVMQLTGALNK